MRRAALTLAGALLAGCATEAPTKTASGEAALFKAQIGDISGGVRPGPHSFWYVQYNPSYSRLGTADWASGRQLHGSALTRWWSRMTHHGAAAPATAIAGRTSGLPVPSIVEVTNVSTGAVVEARVEDVGEANGALISLSPDLAGPLGADASKPLVVRVRYKAPVIAWREQPTLQYALRGRIEPPEPAKPAAAPVMAAQTRAAPVAPPAPTPALPAPSPATVIKTDLPVAMAPVGHASVVEPSKLVVATADPAPPAPVEKAPEAPSAPSVSAHVVRVQAGAFASLANAHRAVGMVADAGAAQIEPVKHGARTLYRVIVRGHPNETGDALRAKVAKAGFADAHLLPS